MCTEKGLAMHIYYVHGDNDITVELGALESTPGREIRYFSNSVKPNIAAI